HAVFNIAGKAAKPVKARSAIVTFRTPKRWVHETSAVCEHNSLSFFSMTSLAFAFINDFSFQDIGGSFQIREVNRSGAHWPGTLFNIFANPFKVGHHGAHFQACAVYLLTIQASQKAIVY